MKLLKSNPRLQIDIILFLLFVSSAWHLAITHALFLFVFAFGGTVVFDSLFSYIRFKSLKMPFAGAVTGLILTLIIDPSAAWWQILIIAGAAMALKHFLRISGRHLVNPAASGLFIGWLLFGLNPSWWAASFYDNSVTVGNIAVLIFILSIIYVSGYRLRRYVTIGTYLGVFAILSVFIFPPISLMTVVTTLLSIGTLFYAFLMLPEPMTSPINKKRQLFYGITVAVLNAVFAFIFTRASFNAPDASIVALLLGNLLFFKFR